MGRKLDLSGLTEDEAEHVLHVVQRDMRLRKKEEERLSELRQELEEEGSRCVLLSRQRRFNQRCCIRCCSPFTFLLNPRRQCVDCSHYVCKACRVYRKTDRAWLCSACQKSRLLKSQSLEWFYANVKVRFKRFGSAKVLKTLYKKHLAEHGVLSELTEGSAYEESIGNEGSICGSDSTFYRQSEEHSMADTLTVALRVAEEAIDEAISKAEFHTDSLQKQDEARYLREHRDELIEELAKTIVQKIVSRRKSLAELKPDCDLDWPSSEHRADHRHHHQPLASAAPGGRLGHSQPHSSLQANLRRSRSAFSILDFPELDPCQDWDPLQGFKQEGGGTSMSTWKSVDRLDNSSTSPVLQSPDGNWIALQSTQLPRPSLLARRKSDVFAALEKESTVVSAYDDLGSDNDIRPEPDSSWGAALLEIHRKMANSPLDTQDISSPRGKISSPSDCRRGSRGGLFSDPEGNVNHPKSFLALLKRKVPQEIRRPSSSRRTSIIDVNFNTEGAESSGVEEQVINKVRRSRKKRKSKKYKVPLSSSVPDYLHELQDTVGKGQTVIRKKRASDAMTSDNLTSGTMTPEPFDLEIGETDEMHQELAFKLQQLQEQGSRFRLSSTDTELEERRNSDEDGEGEKRRDGSRDKHWDDDERSWKMDTDGDEERTDEGEEEDSPEERPEEEEAADGGENKELKYQLSKLIGQTGISHFSSAKDESDKAGRRRDREGDADKGDQGEFTSKLRELERQVQSNQFSSTEDELDRAGLYDGKRDKDEREGRKKEELASTLCRLAKEINPSQFSSTEDELDRLGRWERSREEGYRGRRRRAGEKEEEEEEGGEETLWGMQAEKERRASQVRDLASLVSASQFSSTDDELNRMGENEGEDNSGKSEEVESIAEAKEDLWFMRMERRRAKKTDERRVSLGGLDVRLFEVEDHNESEASTREDLEMDTTDEIREARADMGTVSHGEKQSGSLREDRKEAEVDRKPGSGITQTKQDPIQGSKEGNEDRQKQDLHLAVGGERTAEHAVGMTHTDASQAKAQHENSPHTAEVERSDREVEQERKTERKMEEGAKSMGSWYGEESEPDEAFDKIISSMLMLSPEKTQSGTTADGGKERFKEAHGEGGLRDDRLRKVDKKCQGEEKGEEDETDQTEAEKTKFGEELDRERIDVQTGVSMSEETKTGDARTTEESSVSRGRRGGLEKAQAATEQRKEKMYKNETSGVGRRNVQRTETDAVGRSAADMSVTELPHEEEVVGLTGDRWERIQVEEARQEPEQARGQGPADRKVTETREDVVRSEAMETDETAEGTGKKHLENPEETVSSDQEGILSPEEINNRYSAVSLRSITTEVLKVLNATEDLLQDMASGEPCSPRAPGASLPPGTDPKKLDQQFSRLEENVYVAAGTVFSLEAELGDLEECARAVGGATSDTELSFLEEQVASAAAKVQQSEMQISDISVRIAALKSAGLDVDPQSRVAKTRTVPVMPITLDSTRQLRRRLPVPPMQDNQP